MRSNKMTIDLINHEFEIEADRQCREIEKINRTTEDKSADIQTIAFSRIMEITTLETLVMMERIREVVASDDKFIDIQTIIDDGDRIINETKEKISDDTCLQIDEIESQERDKCDQRNREMESRLNHNIQRIISGSK